MRSPGHLPPRAQPAFRHGLGEPRGNGRRDDAAARGAQGGDTPEQSEGRGLPGAERQHVADPEPRAPSRCERHEALRTGAAGDGANDGRRWRSRRFGHLRGRRIRTECRPRTRGDAQERRKSEGCHGGKGGKYHPLVVKRSSAGAQRGQRRRRVERRLHGLRALVTPPCRPPVRTPARRFDVTTPKATGTPSRARRAGRRARSRCRRSRSAASRRGSRSRARRRRRSGRCARPEREVRQLERARRRHDVDLGARAAAAASAPSSSVCATARGSG